MSVDRRTLHRKRALSVLSGPLWSHTDDPRTRGTADVFRETLGGFDVAILDLRLPDGSPPVTNVEQLRNNGMYKRALEDGWLPIPRRNR